MELINNHIMNKLKKGEYGAQPFNIIQESEILSKADIDSLLPLTEELQETFKKSQVFRTRTEMEVSVLNDIKHPTHASKYWQAVREQNVMFTEMVMLSYEYRKNAIEIKKLQRDIQAEQDDLERELTQIEIEKKLFIQKGQEKVAKDRIREINEWSDIKAREAKHMTATELGSVDNHQLVSYTKRWLRQAATAGNSGSPSENQNLRGQLNAGLMACREQGILEEVLKDAPEKIKAEVEKQYLQLKD